ncbi:MAG: lipid-A-disaccharide synthase [Thiotrichaceae bacterium]|nr:lipid-A-disaccharide synthase [Thiotrichaceae bacterium]
MASKSKPHIMLLAGETSGDAHAAAVVSEIKKIQPDILFTGMGGHEMQKAGVEIFFDSARIAVMGLFEVLKHWGDIKQAMRLIKLQLETTRPDLLVLVDYPEFNLKMAKHAKSLGIKVLFYISPKVWASRPKRIHKIGQSIDHMAVIFKFETDIYQQANIPVTFVGNPLVDKVKSSDHAELIQQNLQHKNNGRIIGLFPGSRKSELSRLLPVMLETAELMLEQDPDLSFVMPVAINLDLQAIQQQCEHVDIDITFTQDNLYDVINSCDAIVSCSGTVTLEIGLLEVPMCVVYKLSWLSYQILSRIVTIDQISLVNIIAREQVVLELLQDEASAKSISQELFKLLDNTQYRQQVLQGLQKVKNNMGPGEGSKRMAELVLSFI